VEGKTLVFDSFCGGAFIIWVPSDFCPGYRCRPFYLHSFLVKEEIYLKVNIRIERIVRIT